MKLINIVKLKSIASALVALATIVTPSTTVLVAAATTGIVLASAEQAEAQTVRMNNRQSRSSVSRNTRQTVRQVTRTPGNAGRDIARNANQAGRQVSRNTRQSVRQISRRHFYALPTGYRWVTFGKYRYCYHGGLHYYPYMHSGKTVYIQVDVSSSSPTPPSSTQVIVNVN
ncbi:MAG: Ni/Co efflux regulator RcnB [Verrucomicrobiales bacterium]|jgi:Ni/Co efflux regulator RcnB